MKERSGSAAQPSRAADRAPEEVRRSWTRSPTLRAFQYPAYRMLWTAGLLVSFGNWIERLAVGWLVFNQTGSVFLTALAFAVRHAPSLLVAPFAGAADYPGRIISSSGPTRPFSRRDDGTRDPPEERFRSQGVPLGCRHRVGLICCPSQVRVQPGFAQRSVCGSQ